MHPLKPRGTLQAGNHRLSPSSALTRQHTSNKQRKSDIKNGQASGSVMAFYDSIVEMLG